MACSLSNSPIDISISSSHGNCDLKCDYRFNYPSSTCNVKHMSNYLSLAYDSGTASPVIYNTHAYNVSEVRIYPHSLHTFGGKKADGEIIIVHTPILGGKQLLVCVPVRSRSVSATKSGTLMSMIARSVANNAQNEGDSTNIQLGSHTFTLNDFVPRSPFFSYTAVAPYSPCQNDVAIIVFDMSNSTVDISNQSSTLLKKIVTKHGYRTKNGTPFFYNSVGSRTKTGEDEIYIDCKPVGESSEQVPVSTSRDTSTDAKPLWEYAAFKDTMQVFIGIGIFAILVGLVTYAFNAIKSDFGKGIKKGGSGGMSRFGFVSPTTQTHT